jgi:hypothetical protein
MEALDDLVARAGLVFSQWNDRLPTGAGGLSRGDLRRLQNAGYVRSQLHTIDKTGQLIRIWFWKGDPK